MGRHSRNENDPTQRAREFDELDEVYTRGGREREERRQREAYRVTGSSAGGESCMVAVLALVSGLCLLGWAIASAKGWA